MAAHVCEVPGHELPALSDEWRCDLARLSELESPGEGEPPAVSAEQLEDLLGDG